MDFTILRYIIVSLVLIYASFCDFEDREVPDNVWYYGVLIGGFFVLLDLFLQIINLQSFIISIFSSLILGLSMFYLGFLGGADTKALIFMGLTIPSYPIGFSSFLGDLFAIPVLTVFLNALIVSLAVPLWIAFTNLIDMMRGKDLFDGIDVGFLGKIVLSFTTKRISLKKLRQSLAYFPAEKPEKKGDSLVREPIYFLKAEDDISGIIEMLNENEEMYRDGLLASPTIPMIIFITIGIVLLPLGNIFYWFISTLVNFS